jgi:hypothetical protein
MIFYFLFGAFGESLSFDAQKKGTKEKGSQNPSLRGLLACQRTTVFTSLGLIQYEYSVSFIFAVLTTLWLTPTD